jgi:hypothetical protein
MPLRDHFRSPLDDQRHWEGFHATWPVMVVAELAVPLELEESYEQSCEILNIPLETANPE